ncbi:MAG TPA: carbamate kinase [Vicinamibacteria bacterium]|nr:carbamate kinase [Vicinamibacteria bacterium]
MRVVVALGGNALLKRGEAMTAANQRDNVRVAAQALAPLAERHALVVSHGNGPQVGLLALQAEAYRPVEPYPLDVLGAESEGMIGYLIEQELGSLLPGRPLATVLTMVEVDAHDPAFDEPSKPIGPVYDDREAKRIRAEGRWALAHDGEHWRRVVASPLPRRILEIQAIQWLLEKSVTVICAGGGGIPTVRREDGRLEGVEAVIDKDRASALLASQLDVEVLILATDVDAVYADWREPRARPLRHVTPSELSSLKLDAGSMGPKVEAACGFVEGRPARRAVIGALAEVEAMLEGSAGTQISASP